MKTTILAITLFGSVFITSKAATLTFTNVGAGALATGFGDATGNATSGLIWGVVIDTTGNGFASGGWDSTFSYNANVGGIILKSTLTGLNTDDVLFLHTSLTTSRTGDGVTASGSINSISTITFTNGTSGNDSFGIIWFDRGIALSSVSADNQKYGFITQGLNTTPGFILPAGEADNADYSGAFAGTDPNKTTSFTLGKAVPEPSSILFGAFGVFVIFRRRRN